MFHLHYYGYIHTQLVCVCVEVSRLEMCVRLDDERQLQQDGPGAGNPRVTPGLSSHSTLQKRISLSEERLRRRISPQLGFFAVTVACWGCVLLSESCGAEKWMVIPACQTACCIACASGNGVA